MSKKSTKVVMGDPVPVVVGGREFNAARHKQREKFLFGQLPALEARTAEGDEEAQAKYDQVVARILSSRAVDAEPVSPDWIGDQDGEEITNALLVILGVREVGEGSARTPGPA